MVFLAAHAGSFVAVRRVGAVTHTAATAGLPSRSVNDVAQLFRPNGRRSTPPPQYLFIPSNFLGYRSYG